VEVELILAVLAAPGRLRAAAGLGVEMASRHPGARQAVAGGAFRPGSPWNECHHLSHLLPPHPWGGLPLPLHQRSVGFLSGGDSPARLIAKGGVELPGWMAGGQAIVQRLGLRSQGHLFRAGLTEAARAKGQGKALRCLGRQGGQQLQRGQAGLEGVLPPARASAGRTA
jgi:hypothetical protein